MRGCLLRCVNAAALLEHEAAHLLTQRLAEALLGARRSLPRDVKTAALGLVFTVGHVAGGRPRV